VDTFSTFPSVISLKKKKHSLKTNFKQIKEKVIEGVLMLSSAATSITVILIVFSIYRRCWVLLENPLIKGFIGSKWVKSSK
jgi:phosphate transport system permease protein